MEQSRWCDGSLLGNVGKVHDKTWIKYDVTALVTGNGSYSFVLVGDSSKSMDFTSRDAATSRNCFWHSSRSTTGYREAPWQILRQGASP